MNHRPTIDIIVEAPQWNAVPGVKPALRRAIGAAASPALAARLGDARSELAIVLTNDEAIRALNRQWRGRDQPTNVLSFPSNTRPDVAIGPRVLGDVVIAYETTAHEAQAQGVRFDHHLAHLAVHGFLHLLGYDHESDKEAETMERLEREILARLDVPDPYASRDEADGL
jgi:probable rRNA maturation factor